MTVIDLYSIKPINEEELRKAVTTEHIITVEDHWFEGGLGDAVLNVFARTPGQIITKLAVRNLPHSGTPAENLHTVGIDCQNIINIIKKL